MHQALANGIMTASRAQITDMITIYHNPRCSKSRGALERVQQFAAEHAIDLNIVDYQKTPPTQSELRALHQMLQCEGPVTVRDMVRDGEDAYVQLNLKQADDEALLDALVTHPILLQRPIVTYNGRGIIARPPELVERVLSR
jgi:arsenate reductase